jgi:hypothetical protein
MKMFASVNDYCIDRTTESKMTQRTCVGCEEPLVKAIASREHILPEWLAAKVEDPALSLKHYRHDQETAEDEILRTHDLGSFAIKNVCVRCNNGWMSRLETKAKPTLLGLMHMRAGLFQLSVEERANVSAWAIKTAFMLSSPQKTIMGLPWHLFRRLKEESAETIPSECVVLAAQLPFLPRGFLYACPTDELSAQADLVQVRVGFSINHLHFVVVIPIAEGPRAIRTTGIHIPLWPLDLDILVRYAPFPTLTSPNDLINYLTNLVQAGLIRGPEDAT